MVGSLFIFLREGLEGSMIVAIILAYLKQIKQEEHRKDVWIAVGAALAVSFAAGLAAYITIRQYDGSRLQTVLEGCTYFVAAIVLTYMTFWMRNESIHLKGNLQNQISDALREGSGMALGLLIFVSVLREGVETVIFLLAIALASPPAQVIAGAVVGLAMALGLSHAIYRLGMRINLSAFFSVIGTFLMISAAGLLADGIQNFQALGYLPQLSGPLWSTSAFLPEQSFVGDLLHSFLGYAQSPSALQLLLWAAYLVGVLYFLWRTGPKSRTHAST